MESYSFSELSEAAKKNAINNELERRKNELGSEGCLIDEDGNEWDGQDVAEYLTEASVLSAIDGGWNYFYGKDSGLDRWTAEGDYIEG